MKAELTATIVDGLLRPDEILSFPNQTRVKLTIETIEIAQDAVAAWESLKARLGQRPVTGNKRFTRDELHERG